MAIRSAHPGLSKPEETAKRWRRFAKRPTPALRETLILQYTPLVKYVLARLSLRIPAVVDSDDLLSAGTIGLIEAVGRFDPEKGVKFETYAITRIRGSMIDALRRADRLPRSVRANIRRVDEVESHLRANLGREPDSLELANALEVSVERYREMRAQASWVTVSLDKLLGPETQADSYLESEEPDPMAENVPEVAERRELVQRLATAIQTLPEREQLVVSLYYQDELTQKEVAKVLGVSESRVCQIHARALERLRAAMHEPDPEPTHADAAA